MYGKKKWGRPRKKSGRKEKRISWRRIHLLCLLLLRQLLSRHHRHNWWVWRWRCYGGCFFSSMKHPINNLCSRSGDIISKRYILSLSKFWLLMNLSFKSSYRQRQSVPHTSEDSSFELQRQEMPSSFCRRLPLLVRYISSCR